MIRTMSGATRATRAPATGPTTRARSGPGSSAPSWMPGSPCVAGARRRRPRPASASRRPCLPPLLAHLGTAGLGHVSEVADGDPPHAPGGCPFQAWSLGELLRVRAMLDVAEDEPDAR